MIRFLQPPLRYPKFYLKEFPFHLNKKAVERVRSIGRFLGIMLLTAIIGYIVLDNFAPLGIKTHYVLGNTIHISDPGPKTRVKINVVNEHKMFYQLHDLIYFTTVMPFAYDKATVRIVFQNPYPDQTLFMGFQDRETWHYDTTPIDVPFLNDSSWYTLGKNSPILYQRKQHYGTVDDFLKNPPKDALIGTYAYDTGIGKDPVQIANYRSTLQDTVIDSPLRGNHVLYTYLHNEPFKMIIEKQDLNWYEDPDPMTIKVYKDKDLVYQITTDDDGIQNASHKTLPPQEIYIQNPGPDLPENGVYKIIINANTDTLIKKISTNLHKIVFAGSLFLAGNHQVYPSVASTSATHIYTDALSLSATTYHTAGIQNIIVGNQILPIQSIHQPTIITPQEKISKVIIPQNDIVLNGFQGYFAFNQDQFFNPTPYHILPLTNPADVQLVDYVLTDYTQSSKTGGWQVAEKTFDIRSAVMKNGRLSWVINAPNLNENNHQILIGSIEVTLYKNPWL